MGKQRRKKGTGGDSSKGTIEEGAWQTKTGIELFRGKILTCVTLHDIKHLTFDDVLASLFHFSDIFGNLPNLTVLTVKTVNAWKYSYLNFEIKLHVFTKQFNATTLPTIHVCPCIDGLAQLKY